MITEKEFQDLANYVGKTCRGIYSEERLEFMARCFEREYKASKEMQIVSPVLELLCKDIRTDMDFDDDVAYIKDVRELDEILRQIIDDIQ